MRLDSILEARMGRVKKQEVTEERLIAQLDNLRKLISFFREYPDLFVDFIKGPNCKFRFFFYQRVFLRAAMRHRYFYATYPRAFSKSFLTMLILVLRCILYPGSELFVTTGGKEQAASITCAKIDEICRLIPALHNEIKWGRGESKHTKDDVEYIFKCGSKINILPATERSRGQRRVGGAMEECVLIDQKALNEIVIPTTNVDRLLPDGHTRVPSETVNKSQVYITTAGYKNTFAYDKLIELLVQSIVDEGSAMIMGGTYKVPVKEGLLNEDFVDQLKMQDTFSEESFDREYNSKWCGDAENAFFSSEKFDKHRVLLQPEFEKSGRSGKNSYYMLAIDVGRFDCTTEVMVFKVTPQAQGSSIKSLVNIFTYEAEHFEEQSINIKRLYFKFDCAVAAIDANGVGAGLVDFLVISQIDPETGDELPAFGVMNDEDGKYKKLRTANMIEDALFLIKANAPINTEAYTYAQSQISSGKVKFLVDEATAKGKLMDTKVGQNMSLDQRNKALMPFVLTSVLREQMLNLVQENEGVNIILKQSSKKIKKDKFSAFIYGLYYVKKEEEKKKKKRSGLAEMTLFTKNSRTIF